MRAVFLLIWVLCWREGSVVRERADFAMPTIYETGRGLRAREPGGCGRAPIDLRTVSRQLLSGCVRYYAAGNDKKRCEEAEYRDRRRGQPGQCACGIPAQGGISRGGNRLATEAGFSAAGAEVGEKSWSTGGYDRQRTDSVGYRVVPCSGPRDP